MDKWLRERRARLKKSTEAVCNLNNGSLADDIKNLQETGHVFNSYTKLTENCPKFAVESKRALFVDSTKLMCQVGAGNRGRSDDILPDGADGESITRRTRFFYTGLAKNTHRWWELPKDGGGGDDYADKNRTEDNLDMEGTWSMTEGNGVFRVPDMFDSHPLMSGTYIHMAFAETISQHVAQMFGWDPCLEHFIPGRLVHPGLLNVAVTPDALCTVNKDNFYSLLDTCMEGQSGSVTYDQREMGAPRMVLEIKSLHRKSPKCSTESAEVTVSVQEVNDLKVDTSPESKVKALALVTTKLEHAGWIPKNMDPRDWDLVDRGPVMKRQRLSSKRATCSFFRASTLMYPSSQYKELVKKVTFVGPDVFPNIVAQPTTTHRKNKENQDPATCFFEKGVTEWCTEQEKPQTRQKDGKGLSKVSSKRDRPADRVYLRGKVNPGKACILLFSIGTGCENIFIRRWDFDSAPLMLNPASGHFTQVLGQNCVFREYGNESLKNVFAVSFKGSPLDWDHTSRFQRIEKDDKTQLAMVYAYDVGIETSLVDLFNENMAVEIGHATFGDHEGRKYLCGPEYRDKRQKHMFRSFKKCPPLAEPVNVEKLKKTLLDFQKRQQRLACISDDDI